MDVHVRRIKITKNGAVDAEPFGDDPSDEYLLSHTAQLLISDDSNKVVSLASAALVDWGCETYVLTAGHCVRPNMRLLTGERADGVGYGEPLGPFYAYSSKCGGGLMCPNGGVIDFAYTKIDPRVVARRKVSDGQVSRWITIKRIGPAFPSRSEFAAQCSFAGVGWFGSYTDGSHTSCCMRFQREMKLTTLVDEYIVMEFPFTSSHLLDSRRYQGCSGAPIFNRNGTPIAIVCGMYGNILYGVPLSYVWDEFVVKSEFGYFKNVDAVVSERSDGHIAVKKI